VTDDVIDDVLAVEGHRITLQLRCHVREGAPAERPVEGELECEDGSIRSFTGWLGLVNELERVVAGSGASGSD
jgi:hypothetical protein